MATKRRAKRRPARKSWWTGKPKRKAPKRRASKHRVRKWAKRRAQAALRKAAKATQKVREVQREATAKRKAEAKLHVSRDGTTPVTKAPIPGAAALAALIAFWRANNLADLANGKANDARNRANDLDHRRTQRHSTFVCYGHVEPQRFATAAELNAHLELDHPEDPVHDIGSESKPIRNMTPPSRPPGRPRATGGAGRRPRQRGSGPRGTKAAQNLAGEAMATLGDIGTARITSVSQIKDIAAAIEKLALQFQEAIEGFQQNGRTSEQAPIDQEVLATLDPAKAGAEQIRTASVAFVSAFDEHYAEDVREAQAGERMGNEALTS
jgi:hypothetical protein